MAKGGSASVRFRPSTIRGSSPSLSMPSLLPLPALVAVVTPVHMAITTGAKVGVLLLDSASYRATS